MISGMSGVRIVVDLDKRPAFYVSVFKDIRIGIILIIVKYSLELVIGNLINFLALQVKLRVDFRLSWL